MKSGFISIIFICSILLTSCRTGRNKTKTKDTRTKIEIEKPIDKQESSSFNFGELINDWIGSPYKYGGCTKEGTDCSGLVYTFYKEVYGIDLPRSTRELYEKAKKISESEAKPGDLVFFAIKNKQVSHVGMFMNEQKFIHSSTSKGVIVSSLTEPYYRNSFIGFGSFRN